MCIKYNAPIAQIYKNKCISSYHSKEYVKCVDHVIRGCMCVCMYGCVCVHVCVFVQSLHCIQYLLYSRDRLVYWTTIDLHIVKIDGNAQSKFACKLQRLGLRYQIHLSNTTQASNMIKINPNGYFTECSANVLGVFNAQWHDMIRWYNMCWPMYVMWQTGFWYGPTEAHQWYNMCWPMYVMWQTGFWYGPTEAHQCIYSDCYSLNNQ